MNVGDSFLFPRLEVCDGMCECDSFLTLLLYTNPFAEITHTPLCFLICKAQSSCHQLFWATLSQVSPWRSVPKRVDFQEQIVQVVLALCFVCRFGHQLVGWGLLPSSNHAKRVQSVILAIDDSNFNQAMEDSNLYTLRFNLSHLC